MKSTIAVLMGIAWVAVMTVPASAYPIPIAGVTCTGYFNESESFPCENAIDGRTDDSDGSANNWSFWLGRSYQSNEALTFDLASNQEIIGFTIHNTHNRQYNDRGTDGFLIYISSSLATPGIPASYGNLVVDDSLTFYTSNPNPPQYFALNSPVTGRYVTFVTQSFPSGISNGLGISEFEVSGIPEPSSTFLVAVGLALFAGLRQRSRTKPGELKSAKSAPSASQ